MNIERLKKIKALADADAPESENARRILERELVKAGLREADLSRCEVKPFSIYYNRKWEKQLIFQLVMYVLKKTRIKYGSTQKPRSLIFKLSQNEHDEVVVLLALHKPYVKEVFDSEWAKLQQKMKKLEKQKGALPENVVDAYAIKNDLMSGGGGDGEVDPDKLDELLRLHRDMPDVKRALARLEASYE